MLAEFDIELVGPSERVHRPPSGRLGVYEETLKAGLCFLLYLFIVKLMKAYVLTSSQIALNSWRFVIGLLSLCVEFNLILTMIKTFRYLIPKRKEN